MEWRLCFQCSATATLENKPMVMVGKALYILGKHGEVAFLRLGHLEGGDWLVVGCSDVQGLEQGRVEFVSVPTSPKGPPAPRPLTQGQSNIHQLTVTTDSNSESTTPRDDTTCPFESLRSHG
jgi:hypothetical protein